MRRLFSIVLLCSAPLAQAAEPFTPASADTVLLQRAPGVAKALRAARGADAIKDPVQVAEAVSAAIAQARRSGEPRYYGQAQALLGAAWQAPEPAAPLRLLRATLRQQRHDFTAARADLDALLAQDPRDARVRLLRATLSLVQGDPLRARSDCAALFGQAGLLVTTTCLGAAGGLSGQGASSLAAIELALQRDADAPLTVRLWARTQVAEIAERLGDLPRATEHFAKALDEAQAAGENDVYLKAAHADFLLDQQRAAEVKALLVTETDFDPLLLRLALAENQLASAGDPAAGRLAAAHLKELLARFELATLRGDAPHHREQTMVALHLQNDPQQALQLAQQNWAEQHEPADARLLLQAALAANTPAAAQPVLDWMQRTQIEDVRLKPLAAALGRAP